MNKTLIRKSAAFLACLLPLICALAIGIPHIPLQLGGDVSPVHQVNADTIASALKQANTPVLVEVCAPGYPGCASAERATTDAAGRFAGHIEFLRVDASDPANKSMLQSLLGAQHDVPAFVLFAGGMPIWATTGNLSSVQLSVALRSALAALQVDGKSLVVQATAQTIGQTIHQATLPLVIEFCSNQDQDCDAEAAQVAYAAAFYHRQVQFVVFNIDTATSDQDKALLARLAAAFSLQQVPSFVFIDGKYSNTTGASSAADLTSFVAASLKADAATH